MSNAHTGDKVKKKKKKKKPNVYGEHFIYRHEGRREATISYET